MPAWLKWIVRPKVIIPTVVVVAAIALLFSFGDAKKILAEMSSFNRVDLIWICLLSVIYEAVRFAQWLVLMREQRVNAPIRAQVFAFAGGEATRFIPVGNYFQNYLLTTSEGVDFAYTSAATTLIILYEVVICLAGLVVLGLGGLEWIRPVIAVGVILVGLAGWLTYKFHGSGEAPSWVAGNDRARALWEAGAEQVASFGNGARRIIHPRTIAFSLVLAAVYLVAAAGILYVSLTGVGWTQTPFVPVLGVYFFSLAFALIVPLPVDIGVTELSGVAAFLAIGVDRNAAISAMLINRVLTVGFSLVIFLVVAIITRDEAKKVWNARGSMGTRQGQQVGEPDGQNQFSADWDAGKEPGTETARPLRSTAGQRMTDREDSRWDPRQESRHGGDDDAPSEAATA